MFRLLDRFHSHACMTHECECQALVFIFISALHHLPWPADYHACNGKRWINCQLIIIWNMQGMARGGGRGSGEVLVIQRMLQIVLVKHFNIKLFLSQTLPFTDISTHLDLSLCDCVCVSNPLCFSASQHGGLEHGGTSAWLTWLIQFN